MGDAPVIEAADTKHAASSGVAEVGAPCSRVVEIDADPNLTHRSPSIVRQPMIERKRPVSSDAVYPSSAVPAYHR